MIARLFHYLFAKHQKFESSILYTQNYITNLEEINDQLLACFIIFVIFHCDILQINREHNVYYFVYLLLEVLVNYRFDDVDIKYL